MLVQIQSQTGIDRSHQVAGAARLDRGPGGIVKAINVQDFALRADDQSVSALEGVGAFYAGIAGGKVEPTALEGFEPGEVAVEAVVEVAGRVPVFALNGDQHLAFFIEDFAFCSE